jgi:hypothetical protein
MGDKDIMVDDDKGRVPRPNFMPPPGDSAHRQATAPQVKRRAVTT